VQEIYGKLLQITETWSTVCLTDFILRDTDLRHKCLLSSYTPALAAN